MTVAIQLRSLRPALLAGVTLLAIAIWQIGGAGYIHAKALLAQHLLTTAWMRTLATGDVERPWPWADTWPVARLRIARLAIDQIVLAGASGSSLAFGPGHLDGSAPPTGRGNIVIGGHRDTHFSFLEDIAVGDEFALQTSSGTVRRFRVDQMRILDSRTDRLPLDTDRSRLTLVTCWPFGAITPGGPMRYVVTAAAIEN